MKSQNGFTLVEICVVLAIIGIVTLLGFKGYEGYRTRADARLVMTELFRVNQGLQQEMEMTGAVLWQQYFANKGWANPQDITNFYEPQTGTTLRASFAACGVGLDCLTLELTGLDQNVVTRALNFIGNAANCGAIGGGAAIRCTFVRRF